MTALAFVVICMVGLSATRGFAWGAQGDVLAVRFGADGDRTRVVIDLDKTAQGRVIDAGGEGRVVLALSGVAPGRGLNGGGSGLVRSYEVTSSGGSSRVQLELARGSEIERRFLLPPGDGVSHYRYVVDLKATGAAARASTTPAPRASAPPRRAERPLIVIDAGHGGNDPGASGASAQEKQVTLAAALALKAELEKNGRYRVRLTRDDDRYVDLYRRVAIARQADADLFISLHADAGADPALRGASVYTLADRATGRSAKFVSKDDWFMQAGSHGDHGVSTILLDLTQRMTRNRSATFAEVLLERVSDHQPLLRRSHREAGLAVLLAPDVPAVLLEMGFLTNAADEAVLRDPGKRNRLMGSVAEAIDDYFGQPTKLASN